VFANRSPTKEFVVKRCLRRRDSFLLTIVGEDLSGLT